MGGLVLEKPFLLFYRSGHFPQRWAKKTAEGGGSGLPLLHAGFLGPKETHKEQVGVHKPEFRVATTHVQGK